jgi:hypothetical protein
MGLKTIDLILVITRRTGFIKMVQKFALINNNLKVLINLQKAGGETKIRNREIERLDITPPNLPVTPPVYNQHALQGVAQPSS